MKRAAILIGLVLAACDKPTPEACEKALHNMAVLMGTDNLNTPAEMQGEVRRCRGGSTKKSVECATKATTLDELDKCDFEHGASHAAGSAAAPAPAPARAAGSAGSAT